GGLGLPGLAEPGLGAYLDGFPGAAEGWGVGQVQVADRVDGHGVEDGGGGDVDALGDLGVPVPEQLHAQEAAGGAVAGEAHGDAVAAGVVGLVVISLGLDGDRVEPGGGSFVVAQPGARGGLIEDLHHLGAQAPRELPVPADRVLTGDPALLVRGGAELLVDEPAKRRVNGGQHLGQLFHLDDLEPAGGEGVGHLQADVPGTHDHRAGRAGLLKRAHQRERVAHRVQQVHPVVGAQDVRIVQAADGRPDRHRASANDELVVAEHFLGAVGGGDQEVAADHVDAAGGGGRGQVHPGGFEVCGGAVGQVAPVGDLAGDVVGDTAYGEVRVGVRDDHADLSARVEFPGA